jgi:hypothetical protein
MEILESWLNKSGEAYAIVRDSAGVYRAVWELDGELYDFGGSPGLDIAKFDTIDEAKVTLPRFPGQFASWTIMPHSQRL